MKTPVIKLGLKIVGVLFALGLSSTVFAQDVGVVAGVRTDNVDGDNGVEYKSKTNFQAGLIAKFDVAAPLQVRTGFLYVQRSYDVSLSGGPSEEFKATYFEVPVGLLYKFSDFGGAFIGPALSFNLSKDCPGGSCSGAEVNSSPLAIQVGGSFKFAPQIGFELYYETMTGELAKGAKSPRAVIANLMITFD